MNLKTIATIQNDLNEKFGVPHQSGLYSGVSRIVFNEPYNNPDSLRGMEGFSHIWLIWGFSENPESDTFSPTVRPPRLGGEKREGVFATRSPNRPNPIGLSSVKIVDIVGTDILVEGADLVNGTPIYDIKPYLPDYDCHLDSKGGFSQTTEKRTVSVVVPNNVNSTLSCEKLNELKQLLALDPRPAYQTDERTYGMNFANCNVKFSVKDGVLTVKEITSLGK